MEISSCEKVTFDAAYDRERVTAYLFLPKNASPPFQTVVYYPALLAFTRQARDFIPEVTLSVVDVPGLDV